MNKQIEEMDTIADLLIDFDEMGFAPTTLCPNPEAYAIEWRDKLTNALKGYRKQSEVVTEIVGIISKRIEVNQYHSQGNNADLFHGIYQGRYEAYRDISEIIEQRYGVKMKGDKTDA